MMGMNENVRWFTHYIYKQMVVPDMITLWPWSNELYKAAHTTCAVATLLLLSACSDGSTGNSKATAISRPAQSAALLANDDTTTLSFAQAVAAGRADPADAPVKDAADADDKVDTATLSFAQAVAAGEANAPVKESTEAVVTQPEITDAPTSDIPKPELVQTVEQLAGTGGDAESAVEQKPATESIAEPIQTTAPEIAEANAATVKTFSSTTSDGFVGEVSDNGTVKVTWKKDLKARGYNVYRQAEYITTIFEEKWIQSDLYDEAYYYEIQAFDAADNLYYIATGLTVEVTGTGRTNPDKKPTNEGILDNYELVFSDEFNGDSLDTSKWNTSYLWGDDVIINSEEQYYVDINNEPDFGFNPFTFDGESLTINSIKTPAPLLGKAKGQKYLSGVITSYDAFKFTYGYVETRAKMTFGKGYWPAFWLLNAYYVDDKPEIDIMEFIGDDQDVVYHTYHYYDSDGKLRSTKSDPTIAIDFTSDFHTFAVEWSPSSIAFYVDGIEQHKISDPKVSQQEMYIIANTAIGGWWPGSPDASTPFPGEYKIDYIRAYQRITPFEDFPFFDYVTKVPFHDDVPGSSPSHFPPFELWPVGYPERQQ